MERKSAADSELAPRDSDENDSQDLQAATNDPDDGEFVNFDTLNLQNLSKNLYKVFIDIHHQGTPILPFNFYENAAVSFR